MKMFLIAAALTIAAPAVAQTAAPADPHAGHAQHQAPAEHSGHDGGCCEKDADGKMKCCEAMKAEGAAMACCEKMGAEKTADAHAGHEPAQH